MSDDDARPVSKVARRTLIAGAAWAVPTVAVLSATPAFAASVALNVAGLNLEKTPGGLNVHVGFNNPLTTPLTLTVIVYLTRNGASLQKTVTISMATYGEYGQANVKFAGLKDGDTYSGFVSASGNGVASVTMLATTPPTMTVSKWG